MPGRDYPEGGAGWQRALWWVREIILYIFWYLPGYVLCLLVFRVLCRARRFGRIPRFPGRGYFLMSNHLSALDSFFIGHYLFPRPAWFPAKSELFRNRLLGAMIAGWRAFPVRRGQHDQAAVERMVRLAGRFIVVLHPEGTRSRDGTLGRGKPGAGWVVHRSRAPVVPVYIHGLDRMIPPGKRFPRFGARIWITFGEPCDFGELLDAPECRETSQRIVDTIMERIAELQQQTLREIEAHHARAEKGNQP
jgi:1-acyl-sn-glycerol-3-phosphate acyltransferase